VVSCSERIGIREARWNRLARVRSQVSAEPVDVTLQWRKERELKE